MEMYYVSWQVLKLIHVAIDLDGVHLHPKLPDRVVDGIETSFYP